MPFLQTTLGVSSVLILGTLGMFLMAITLVSIVVFHQRRVIRFNKQIQKMEEERQQMLLRASIQFQEEERQRIAADLHDDAGPLLATARLYLNENLIHQEPALQLQSIFSAKQIIDDSIQLIRNISHSLMPPTLKNFGLEAAIKDLFEKIFVSFGSDHHSECYTIKIRKVHSAPMYSIFRIPLFYKLSKQC